MNRSIHRKHALFAINRDDTHLIVYRWRRHCCSSQGKSLFGPGEVLSFSVLSVEPSYTYLRGEEFSESRKNVQLGLL